MRTTVDPFHHRVNRRDTAAIPAPHRRGTALCHNGPRASRLVTTQGIGKGKKMSSHTAFRRSAAAVGATGLIALFLTGPAAARPDEGAGTVPGPAVSRSHSQEAYECHYLGKCASPGSQGRTQVLRVDDNAVEVLQLGGGLLAGIALAGAGMAAASRRGHAPHPA
jgi:hypothetical protein